MKFHCFFRKKLQKDTWKQRRNVLSSEQRLHLIKDFTLPVNFHLSWHGAVCSRPLFCVQKQQKFDYSSGNIGGFSKQQSWSESHVANWFGWKGKKTKKNCSQNRHSSRQKYVLSSYQALKPAIFNFGWCGDCSFTVRLCSTTLVRTRTLQTFTFLQLTLLVNLTLWFWIEMPSQKKEESKSFSKYELQKLQRLYTQCGAAYPSMRTLVKANNLPVSKGETVFAFSHFVHKNFLATHICERLKAFALFENKIWCMNLAYVDKIAKNINGVKYLLVRQDLFDRGVDAKGMKARVSEKRFVHFWLYLQDRIDPKKLGLIR